MKLRCERTRLISALNACKSALAGRSQNEAWRNYYCNVCADSSIAEFTATNGEVQVQVRCHGVSDTDFGDVLIPPRILDILSSTSGHDVTMYDDSDGILHVECGCAEWHLQTEDPSNFAAMSPVEGETINVDAGKLRDAIARTIYASDICNTRYATGGVCLNLPAAAATDARHHLSVVHLDDCPELSCGGSLVVPVRSCKTIMSLITDESAVGIATTDDAMRFDLGDATVTARLVAGRFPTYQHVVEANVSDSSPVDVTVSVDALIAALKQASCVTSEESRGVMFSLGADEVVLRASADDVGNAESRCGVAACGSGHTPCDVILNPDRVMGYLQSVRGDTQVRITTLDVTGNGGVVFRSAPHHTYIIMPLSREG